MKKILFSLALLCSIFISSCGNTNPSTPSFNDPISNEVPSISNPSNEEPSISEPDITTEPSISEDPTSQHVHSFEEKYTYDETYHWHQSTCGHSEEEIKEKHTFKKKVTESTYETQGFTTYTCTICDYSYVDDYTAVLEHKYSSTYTYNETHHWYQCIDKGYENLKKGEEPHKFNSKITSPTYESGGYTTYTCKSCNYSYVGDYTNALEHKYSSTYSYDETHHWYQCIDKGYEDLKKGYEKHAFKETITPSTYETEGYTTYQCKSCEYNYKGNFTDLLKYKITYHLDGGINSPLNPIGFSIKDEIYLQPATKDGYAFLGWFDKENNQISYIERGTNHDIEITAVWVNPFTIQNGKLVDFDESLRVFSVSIPTSVHTICSNVFEYADYMSMIEIPTSVTHMEEGAFDGVPNLRTVFYKGNLDEWNNIKFDGVDATPMFAADYFCIQDSNGIYSEVTDLVLSNNVTQINQYAFSEMEYLNTVFIPKSVTTIGTFSFKGCGVEEIVFESGSNLKTIKDHAFNQCYYLKTLHLPDGIETIETFAFENCESIAELTLPSTIKTLGRGAFSSCHNIQNITIPSSIKVITEHLFNDCISLVSLEIPTSVTTIEGFAFTSCRSLRSLNIPNSVTSIGSHAFAQCVKLYSVKIPSSVTKIDGYAFDECESAIIYCQAKSQPSGWNYNWYTEYCPIYWNKTPSDIVEKDGIEYIIEGSTAIVSSCVTTSKDMTIEKSVTIKGTIYNVTIIGGYAFQLREDVYSIIIPNTIKTVGDSAFFCADFESIVIPSSVTTIEEDAFDGLYFATFYCEASSQPSSWPTEWCNSTCTIYWKDEWEYDANNKPTVKK